MVDINLVTDDITVLGGPSSISVDLDIGPVGARGSFIFTGDGKPSQIQESQYLPSGYSLQTFDMYINKKSTDDEYMFLYQYKNTGFITEWQKVIRLTPNTFVINQVRDFVDGVTNIEFSPYSAFPSYSNISASDLSIQCTILNQNPVSAGVFVSDIVVSGDLQVLPISIDAIEATRDGSGNIVWSPLNGQKVVQLHITMV
jgi:hypothetical protein